VPEAIHVERIEVGELQTNAYVVFSEKSLACLIIDPGAEPERIIRFVKEGRLKPGGIVLTHGHADHSGGVRELLAVWPMTLMIHRLDRDILRSPLNRALGETLGFPVPPEPARLLENGETVSVAEISIAVIHTPGHTPGSVVLALDRRLFTGDTLFQGSAGRTDLPGGDDGELKRSLRLISRFPPDTLLFPGHGDMTTLEEELASNPFLVS
jgi:hydroxyacylglutathione hydrolase